MLELLLKHGLDPEATDSKGWTAFLVAAGNGDLDAVSLLAPYANVNRVNPVDGESALSLAVSAADLTMVKHLLNLNCDVNSLNPDNLNTPLHLAARNANGDIVAALLERGANVNDKGDGGGSAVVCLSVCLV